MPSTLQDRLPTIARLFAEGMTVTQLALRFGASYSAMYKLLRAKRAGNSSPQNRRLNR
jgi:transposase